MEVTVTLEELMEEFERVARSRYDTSGWQKTPVSFALTDFMLRREVVGYLAKYHPVELLDAVTSQSSQVFSDRISEILAASLSHTFGKMNANEREFEYKTKE